MLSDRPWSPSPFSVHERLDLLWSFPLKSVWFPFGGVDAGGHPRLDACTGATIASVDRKYWDCILTDPACDGHRANDRVCLIDTARRGSLMQSVDMMQAGGRLAG
jgi:hypothetical protein